MQLTKEQLIEELKKDEKVFYSKKGIKFVKEGVDAQEKDIRMTYYAHLDGKIDIGEYEFCNLSPECILELFRNLR